MTTAFQTRRTPVQPLRQLEATLLGALLLGGLAVLSLPTPDWMSLWLLLAPSASLAAAFALRLLRPDPGCADSRPMAPPRRRPVAAMARRRRAPSRRASRLLAALVLR